MTKEQAKTYLRHYAQQCLKLSSHCRNRMRERDVTIDDILYVIMWGNVIDLQKADEHDNWKCVIKGKDIDGDDLVFVAAIDEYEQSVICITVKDG